MMNNVSIDEDGVDFELVEKHNPEITYSPESKFITLENHTLQEIIEGNPVESINKMQKELEGFYQKLEQLKKHISPK